MQAKFYIFALQFMASAQIRGKKRGKKHANKQNRKIKAISRHLTKQACLLHLVFPAQFCHPHYGRLDSPKSEFNWAAKALSFFFIPPDIGYPVLFTDSKAKAKPLGHIKNNCKL